jgi:hypothetical protein
MKSQSEGGFTLVELVFGAVIMAMMVAAVGELYISNLNTVVLGKSRALGLAIANEKIETLRDLPYDSLATQGGNIYPPGNIMDNEVVVRDSFKFNVHTDISYVDDPYDGYITCPCASGPAKGKPQDLYPYDYKKAQITVTLASSNVKVATLTTDLAGKAAETSSNTGILSITVLDASGNPVQNANVTITNINPSPAVNITTTTDNNGLVIIPKLPPYSNNSYQVIASLPGYSTDGTIPDPAGAPTAVELNPNVLVQQITSVTLAIDRISTMYIHAVDTSGNPVSNVAITTTGAKKTQLSPTLYKYNTTTNTDASGNITLSNMEWDSYSYAAAAGYYIVSASPYAPSSLAPNSSLTENLVISTSSTYPRITSVSPTSQQTGTASFSLKVTGVNLAAGSLKLKQTGQSDINATGCVASGGNTILTCNVSLTGAATGAWDIQVTSGGSSVTQSGGFNVTP